MMLQDVVMNQVHPTKEEFYRLLGYPPGSVPPEKVMIPVEQVKEWFHQNANPWITTREVGIARIHGTEVELEGGERLHGSALADRLRKIEAHAVVILAVSAGPEVVLEEQRLWREGNMPESFCLGAYASAAVEQMTRQVGIELCDQWEPSGVSVISHISPGYTGWDLDDQSVLFRLVESQLGGPLEILPSRMLMPQKSMLALFGLTKRMDLAEKFKDLIPCVSCGLASCAYRRVPQGRHRPPVETAPVRKETRPVGDETIYAFPRKALTKWARNYLKLVPHGKDEWLARFEYQGSTCHTGGISFPMVYEVKLSSQDDDFRVLSLECRPQEGSNAHQSMCAFQQSPDFDKKMRETPPLQGWPLGNVLEWTPLTHPAGCLCEEMNRNHKWNMMFQTLHFAVFQNSDNIPMEFKS